MGQVFRQSVYFFRSSASPFVKKAANRAWSGVPSAKSSLNEEGIELIVNIASWGTARIFSPFFDDDVSSQAMALQCELVKLVP